MSRLNYYSKSIVHNYFWVFLNYLIMNYNEKLIYIFLLSLSNKFRLGGKSIVINEYVQK